MGENYYFERASLAVLQYLPQACFRSILGLFRSILGLFAALTEGIQACGWLQQPEDDSPRLQPRPTAVRIVSRIGKTCRRLIDQEMDR